MRLLQSLPLRPTTLSMLLRNGFATYDDVVASRGCGDRSGATGGGSLANLAAELGCVGLAEAGAVWREVREAAVATVDGSGGCLGSTNTEDPRQSRLHGVSNGVTAASLLRGAAAGVRSLSSSAAAGRTPLQSQRHIVTFCRSIDSLLGGGIALSELSELYGPPGSGKTQLGMQICVDARLPHTFGGVEGEAVYLDTEGSFSPERCWDMADSLVRHVAGIARKRKRGAFGASQDGSAPSGEGSRPISGPDAPGLPAWFNPSDILAGIHVLRVHDAAAQSAAIRNLPALLRSRRERGGIPVRAVVIDSVAFHYRVGGEAGARGGGGSNGYGSRTRSLTRLAASLSDLAREYDVAVVAVNHMTTRFGGGASAAEGRVYRATADEGGSVAAAVSRHPPLRRKGDPSFSSRLVPALGESWSHATTTRLLLHGALASSWGGAAGEVGGGHEVRQCRLVKCPHKAAGTALYRILETGIRDVVPASASPSHAVSTGATAYAPNTLSVDADGGGGATKRQRLQ